MKKTLAALAVLGAFAAGSAYAADVTLYGVIDVGLKYTHTDTDEKGVDATDKFEMSHGNQSGSRFGLKGTEDLGNGYSVGFVLENGFAADDGTLQQNDRLFGREASLQMRTPFGEFAFGRMGNLTSGNGTYGIAGNLSPFGTSWSGYAVEGSTYFVGYTRLDNTVTYKSPTFAGFTGYLQYSFNGNTKDKWTVTNTESGSSTPEEGKASANRYAAIGATYKNGGLDLVLTADYWNWSNQFNFADAESYDYDDGFAVTLGGSYDFQVVKAFLGFQYFDNMWTTSSNSGASKTSDKLMSIGTGINDQIQGYAIMAGVSAPLGGGTGMFAVGYADTEAANDDLYKKAGLEKPESTRWGASIGYDYPFSKRTNVYAVAGYYQDSVDNYEGAKSDDRDPSTCAVVIGMRHKF